MVEEGTRIGDVVGGITVAGESLWAFLLSRIGNRSRTPATLSGFLV
jgi:hypothetical protein